MVAARVHSPLDRAASYVLTFSRVDQAEIARCELWTWACRLKGGSPLKVGVGSEEDPQHRLRLGRECRSKPTFGPERRQCSRLQTYTAPVL